MKMLACAALAVLMGATATASAQPAPAGELEQAYAAFDEAAARERAALAARDRTLENMRAREAEALRAAQAEVAARRTQAAEHERLRAELVALIDRIEATQRRPGKLLLEKAVLQDWYDTLQPAVAHLTERSFRGVEAELAALADAGAIEPGARRFRSYLELRNRLAEVGRRLQADAAASARERSALRTQAQALVARRDRLLAQLARPGGSVDAAALRWVEAGEALTAGSANLERARSEVMVAANRVLDAAASQRPPVLTEVKASVDGQSLYQGQWQRGGASADERQRETRRAELRAMRNDFDLAVLEFGRVQRERSELRDHAARRMHLTSGFLQQSAERYRQLLLQQVYINTAVEAAVTTAEIFLTGGAATLARKTTELGQRAAAKAAVGRAVANAGIDDAARIALHAVPGTATSDQLRAAATKGVMSLRQEAEAHAARLVAQGMGREAAQAAAMREIGPMIERLQMIQRTNRLANHVSAEALAQVQRLEQLPDLHEVLVSLGSELPKVPGAVRDYLNSEERLGVAPGGSATSSTLLSEGFEAAIGQARNTLAAGAQQGAAKLNMAGRLRARWVAGVTANKYALGASAAGSIFQVAIAAGTDRVVDAQARHFGDLYTELEFAYQVYRAQLEADKELDAYVNELRNTILKFNVALKMLDAGLALRPVSAPRPVDRDDQLALELGFSAPLAGAPSVSLAGVTVAMQRADAIGQRWRGSVPVARLGGPGAKPLSVSVDAMQTRHGSLDRDPRTPALRLGRRAGWSGFETGADTNHSIAFALRDDAPPLAPVAESDPFEAGRAMVDAGAASIDAQQLVGRWIGTGYYCDGAEPPETIMITAEGNRLTATKITGDACIRAGEVTWRGTLSGTTITGELHVREKDAPASTGEYRAGTWNVLSHREIQGFGVTLRRP